VKSNQIIHGDSLEILKTLPDESVNCVVTSPPYWALRDYGVEGQLGLEPTFQEYITKLCDIFDEVKRVLKKDGTCWVNIGDTYGGTGDKGDWKDPKYSNGRNGQTKALNKSATQKSLCQIPSRFAIEMTNRGWILRNEIIWHKPNCMPSSVKDRFTVDFEKVFFFVKSKKYWFETQYEPNDSAETRMYGVERDRILGYNSKANAMRQLKEIRRGEEKREQIKDNSIGKYFKNTKTDEEIIARAMLGRNKRAVWKIATKPFKEAHFATYPEKLIEPMIKAGCPVNGVVLDPFFGAGTTGLVARKLGRNYIGIELNQEYIKIANSRINTLPVLLFNEKVELPLPTDTTCNF
jgi:DNA modification methylase